MCAHSHTFTLTCTHVHPHSLTLTYACRCTHIHACTVTLSRVGCTCRHTCCTHRGMCILTHSHMHVQVHTHTGTGTQDAHAPCPWNQCLRDLELNCAFCFQCRSACSLHLWMEEAFLTLASDFCGPMNRDSTDSTITSRLSLPSEPKCIRSQCSPGVW